MDPTKKRSKGSNSPRAPSPRPPTHSVATHDLKTTKPKDSHTSILSKGRDTKEYTPQQYNPYVDTFPSRTNKSRPDKAGDRKIQDDTSIPSGNAADKKSSLESPIAKKPQVGLTRETQSSNTKHSVTQETRPNSSKAVEPSPPVQTLQKHTKTTNVPEDLNLQEPPKFSVAFPDFLRLGQMSRLVSRPPANSYSRKVAKNLQENPKKEISAISDRQGHGVLAKPGDVDFRLPDSTIHDQYHVFDDLLDGVTGKSTGKKVKIFPSTEPSNRSEALLLERSFDKMMKDAAGDFQKSLIFFQDCMNEMVRQVGIHCVERGRILSKIWSSYTDMVEKEMAAVYHDLDETVATLQSTRAEADALAGDFDQKLAELEKIEDGLRYSNTQLSEEINFLRQQMEPLLADQETLHKIQRHKFDYQVLMNKVRRIFSRLGKYCDFLETHEIVEFTESDFQKIQKLLEQEESTLKHDPADPFFPDEQELVKWLGDVELLWKYCQDQQILISDLRAAEAMDREMLVDLHLELKDRRPQKSWLEMSVKTTQTDDVYDTLQERSPRVVKVLSKSTSPWDLLISKQILPSAQIPSQPHLYRHILQFFKEKLKADMTDEAEDQPKQNFPEFLYDHYLSKYGVRSVAEQQVVDVIEACNRYQARNSRIYYFAGIIHATHSLTGSAIQFYMDVFRDIMNSEIGVTFEETMDGKLLVDVLRAFYISDAKFKAASFVSVAEMDEKINAAAIAISRSEAPRIENENYVRNRTEESSRNEHMRGGTIRVIDFDDFMDIVMKAWIMETNCANAYLEGLFMSADVNQDNALQYDEFVELIRFADPGVSERQIARVYGEGVKMGGTESLSLETFLALAFKYGIGSMTRVDGADTQQVLQQIRQTWRFMSTQVQKQLERLQSSAAQTDQEAQQLAQALQSTAGRLNKDLESARSIMQVERLFKRVVSNLVFAKRHEIHRI
eukprot:TRINITY_DN6956_c0_g1_i1.p1 TRINITY_DN6956_c0_g1~~TRINITY_DN6956_c0_g1_i1.p1  ORF type:complete len:954 (-),score=186.04 TRINITY_DN6956_c0_g1_i1:48-2909(-)